MPAGPTVDEVIARFWEYAEAHYRRPDGQQSKELFDFKVSLRPVRFLYGPTPAAEFGPLKLKQARQAMVDGYVHTRYGRQGGLSRKVVNQRVGRIVRTFKWAASEELVPASVLEGLRSVAGLQKGRGGVRETAPVEPVALEVVDRTLAHLGSVVASVVRVQLLAGCRAGELLELSLEHLDRRGPVWLYRPASHKGSWRGKGKTIAFGPRAQAVLAPLLPVRCPRCGVADRAGRVGWQHQVGLCGPCADQVEEAGLAGPWPCALTEADQVLPVFSPIEAARDLAEAKRASRKTRVQPSQVKRGQESARKKHLRARPPRDRYDVVSYNRSITRACKRAGVEQWSSHQLRHARATEVRAAHGLEAAQLLLGHERADVTQLYAEKNLAALLDLASRLG